MEFYKNYLSKNIGNYLFLIIVTLTATLKINAGTTFGEGPYFEIQNKTQKPIWVALEKNGRINFFDVDKTHKVDINQNSPLAIGFYKAKPEWYPTDFDYEENKFIRSKPQPDFIYTINAKGKTKYLTWNPTKFNTPNKYLYPQTGPYGGWSGKSESGYNLSKNVTQDDIKYSTEK